MMFYCPPCAKKNEWPETLFQSYGRCEMCGKTDVCNDMPSSQLPDRPKPKPVDYDREVLKEVLIYHARMSTGLCLCGWGLLGAMHSDHVIDVYEESMRAR